MYVGRPTGRLTPQKMEFARSASEGDKVPSGGSLLDAVQQLQPSALIGAAAKQNAFTADTIKALTKVASSVPFARTRLLQYDYHSGSSAQTFSTVKCCVTLSSSDHAASFASQGNIWTA